MRAIAFLIAGSVWGAVTAVWAVSLPEVERVADEVSVAAAYLVIIYLFLTGVLP